MSWSLVDSAPLADGEIALYRDEAGIFMIRVNGYELMNGHCHVSEEVLGALAITLASGGAAPHILLGGLGLGHTLKAALGLAPERALIVQAELSGHVLNWFEVFFAPALGIGRDERLRLIKADVAQLLIAGSYDSIALDVDNGPTALSAASNAGLYRRDGLMRLKAALKPDGCLLVWSGFPTGDFVTRAAEAGFHAEDITIATGLRDDFCHHIAICTQKPLSGPQRKTIAVFAADQKPAGTGASA